MISERPATYRRMTSVTTTAATTAMPSRTRPSTSRMSCFRAGLLVERHTELDEFLALGPEVGDSLSVDLLRDLAQLDQRALRHRVHLHARGRQLTEQLVVVLLTLHPLPHRDLLGHVHDGALQVGRQLGEDGAAHEQSDRLLPGSGGEMRLLPPRPP